MSNKKLKRAVIKEELVALTGDPIAAIILNQFIYWSERMEDFDHFIAEEKQRDPDNTTELTFGWIYKKASDLNEEIMLGMSESSIRTYIKKLIDRGFIEQRTNPKFKWDKTLQYRVNLAQIQDEMNKIGFVLDGYPIPIRSSNFELRESISETRTIKNLGAIPEITTEITTEREGVDQLVPLTGNTPGANASLPLSNSNHATEPTQAAVEKEEKKSFSLSEEMETSLQLMAKWSKNKSTGKPAKVARVRVPQAQAQFSTGQTTPETIDVAPASPYRPTNDGKERINLANGQVVVIDGAEWTQMRSKLLQATGMEALAAAGVVAPKQAANKSLILFAKMSEKLRSVSGLEKMLAEYAVIYPGKTPRFEWLEEFASLYVMGKTPKPKPTNQAGLQTKPGYEPQRVSGQVEFTFDELFSD